MIKLLKNLDCFSYNNPYISEFSIYVAVSKDIQLPKDVSIINDDILNLIVDLHELEDIDNWNIVFLGIDIDKQKKVEEFKTKIGIED